MSYRLYLDANFHQIDTSARAMAGEYDSHALAVMAAQEHINGILQSEYREGMSAEDLMRAYITRAEEPFIIPDDEIKPFTGREYATLRSQYLCRGGR